METPCVNYRSPGASKYDIADFLEVGGGFDYLNYAGCALVAERLKDYAIQPPGASVYDA